MSFQEQSIGDTTDDDVNEFYDVNGMFMQMTERSKKKREWLHKSRLQQKITNHFVTISS